MSDQNFGVSTFYKGGKITSVALTNIDLNNILPMITDKPFDIIRYEELYPLNIPYWTIILFSYPNQIGHWCLLKHDEQNKELYFFDPYGAKPDTQWPYLENPNHLPEPRHKLSEIIHDFVTNKGYKFTWNPYNIQGTIRNGNIRDSECGEIVVLRIMNEDLSDYEFFELCKKLGAYKIFDIIKEVEMLRAYGRKRKSTSTGGRRHTGGRYLYSGGGPLYSGGAVNPWREFVKANKGKFHSFRELAEAYHAMKRGEI
jgi:hypothetical protein